jgi:hypothetical protein
MGGRDQSERLVAINRNSWSRSPGVRNVNQGTAVVTGTLPLTPLVLEGLENFKGSFDQLCLRAGTAAIEAMLAGEVAQLCGERNERHGGRAAHRWGMSQITLRQSYSCAAGRQCLAALRPWRPHYSRTWRPAAPVEQDLVQRSAAEASRAQEAAAQHYRPGDVFVCKDRRLLSDGAMFTHQCLADTVERADYNLVEIDCPHPTSVFGA